MSSENFIRGAVMFLVALGLVLAVLAMNPAAAGEEEENDRSVEKALVERTSTFCKAVLPAWFASERGITDPAVRMVVADCYMGHARLAILGVEDGFSLEGTALAEVPAVLLRRQTGMNLDIYRPLAGRTLRTHPREE